MTVKFPPIFFCRLSLEHGQLNLSITDNMINLFIKINKYITAYIVIGHTQTP